MGVDLAALVDASIWAPAIAVLGLFLGLVPLLDRRSDAARTALALAIAALAGRYLAWRLTATVLPFDGTAVETAWVWAVFAVEVLAFVEIAVFLLIMSRADRGPARADAAQAALAAHGDYPRVDVFIPTYNEGPEVLEKSILGARAMDYPNFRVFVLDDGRRAWLADFCRAAGVGYLTRPDNAHAKAGNLNAGLARTDGALVAVFDADFVPHRNFLTRTVGLFADPEIGIVQTPQHFFNKDPVQLNLQAANDLPDEQRLFFDEMAASRDAWNAAFCCGSCSVMRRAALAAAGGIPTASITEDLLTTLVLRRAGYRTVYLNEKLSQGLAAESLEAFFVQRARWAQGGIQTIFLKDGPLFSPGLGMLERVLFFPWSWVIQYPVRLAALVIPVVYLFTGLVPLQLDSLGALVDHQLPVLLAYVLGMRWFAGRRYVPLLSTAVGTFGAFRLLPTVVASLIRPFGTPFRVTPKGTLARAGVDWVSFAAIMTLALMTAGGLALNALPGRGLLTSEQIFPVAAAWGLVNLVLLLLASLICFDAPRRRGEERFHLDRPAGLALGGGRSGRPAVQAHARVADLSLTGAQLRVPATVDAAPGERAILHLPGLDGELAGRVVRAAPGSIALALTPGDAVHRARLIGFLFSGAFQPGRPETPGRRALWRQIWRRFTGPATA